MPSNTARVACLLAVCSAPALCAQIAPLEFGSPLADSPAFPDLARVDQWPGQAGAGWSGPWRGNEPHLGEQTVEIVTHRPLTPDSEAYLHVDRRSPASSPGKWEQTYTTVSRGFDGISSAAPHRVSFLLRLDSELSALEHENDYLQVFAYTDEKIVFDFNPECSWLLRGQRAPDSLGQPRWFFYDGERRSVRGLVQGNMVDTGVPLLPGLVYAVQIDTDPASGRWTGRISCTIDGRPLSFTRESLGFRTQRPDAGAHLYFGLRNQSSGPAQSLAFSLDSVRVIPLPRTHSSHP